MKTEIVEWLGQSDLLLPQLIAEGLAANDRVKARLSVLQAAAQHADDPLGNRIDLTEECRSAGLDPIPLQALVHSAMLAPGAKVTATGLGALGKAIWDDMAAMLRAVQAGDAAKAETYVTRLDAIKAASQLGADAVASAEIARLTAISEVDSLHRVIMDLHRALNALAATHAQEVVAGAHSYGLTAEDKQALEAFMQGVESTRALKFDHPGLGTTALRAGARFTIQNDIGETDAHVVVIGVEPAAVTITYTDVHHARAKFFTRLFRDFPVRWSGLDDKTSAALKDQEAFYLITGRYPYADAEERDSFLRALGASLVFQIDWNKARKVLRAFVGNADAVRLLDWAAARRVGHRGFLQLGGADLINAAVRHAAPARIGFGDHFDQVLGREAAIDFLKAVLRISVEALRQGSSQRSAKARIEEALVTHLQRGDTSLLAVVIRQAGLARDIAVAIAQFIDDRRRKLPTDAEALARRAGRIEEKADRIVFDARGEIARFGVDRGLERLTDLIEQTIDELEEAAFIASLAPADTAPELLESLAELAAVTVSGTEAAIIGAAAAAEIPEGQRVDYEDALAAATRLVEDEHRGDTAERTVTTKILGGSYDLKASLAILSLAHPLERATDQLARFGHSLRDYVLSDLSS